MSFERCFENVQINGWLLRSNHGERCPANDRAWLEAVSRGRLRATCPNLVAVSTVGRCCHSTV